MGARLRIRDACRADYRTFCHRALALALGLAAMACSGDGMDGAVDAADPADAGATDARAADGGAGPDPGFGAIAGPCGRVGAELGEPTPSLFATHLDFMADPFDDPQDVPLLTPGGQELLAEGTAGGSSIVSEVFAYEVLDRCEAAALLKSETEIVYDTAGSLTDMLVAIDGIKVGVSVTRAFGFPPDDPYTVTEAEALLSDKLAGILESSTNVSAQDAWVKQILVVMAYAEMHGESVRTAWDGIDPALRADTIVYVVVTDGADGPLY